MPEGKEPISFPLWVLLNYLAWLIFWLFIEPIGAWLLYDRFYEVPFSTVLWRIWQGIQWLPMGLFMLAYNLFYPLSFYSWIYYPLLVISYVVYRLLWRKRNSKVRSKDAQFKNAES